MSATCFHCAEPIPVDVRLIAHTRYGDRPVCCIGCLAAAQWIEQLGLADYYRLRSVPAPRAEPSAQFDAWDRPALARMHVRELAPHRAEAVVLVDGLRCAACAWLIERMLGALPGVHEIGVNAAARRVRIVFDPARTRLSQLLLALARLGYAPHPLTADSIDSLRQREARTAMKRLVVAGLGAMQAMMYAVALYAGVFEGIDPAVRDFFRWLGLLVATPVVLYSARPFFEGARREWAARHLSMDTPVALAIALIYLASIVATFNGSAEVYFDSVTMFVFFLLLGRYLEMRTRHRANDVVDALARLQPATAQRVSGDRVETVGVHELSIGDIVRVGAGATIPADGVLVRARCRVDESLLSGESAPRARFAGDAVIGGSIALDGPVDIEVRRIGADTTLAGIVRLITRAGSARPRLAQTADGYARRFVPRVFAATALTALVWLWIDPSRAFASALAVLVVSCPCAFALAAPAALTRAVAVLARRGVLVVEADALEALARADRFVFDKTGTLTQPAIDIASIRAHRGTRERALALAAALEQSSSHPLAAAVRDAARGLELPKVTHAAQVPGGGVTGAVAGVRLRLGRAGFALDGHDDAADDALVLADAQGAIARLPVIERTIADGPRIVAALREDDADCELLSGDHPARVRAAAEALRIRTWNAGATPAGKLAHIQRLRREGRAVAMVGDGVNDAPVLASADVAIAIGSGAALAHAASGILLAGTGVEGILPARRIARQMLRTLRRNLIWSVCYNLAAIPIAAAGFVPPWLAALGMSASSLIVIASSMTIGRDGARSAARTPEPFDSNALATPT